MKVFTCNTESEAKALFDKAKYHGFNAIKDGLKVETSPGFRMAMDEPPAKPKKKAEKKSRKKSSKKK